MNCYVQTLGCQSELTMNIYDPFNQKGPGSVLDFILDLGEVVGVHHGSIFFISHAFIDRLGELGEVLGVPEVELVG